MAPGTQRICNTFCRPLNVSARAQARHAVAPMFEARALRDAHMVTFFFFADFVTCAIFQICEANFSKPKTNANTMFSLIVAQDPRLHFRRKKISKKNSASWFFFQKNF